MSDREGALLGELVLAHAFEFQALLNVLERQGLITRGEALEEIRRLREKAPKAGKVW